MTRKTADVPRPPRTDGRANAHEAEGHRYSAEAVQREIAKDRRIKPKGTRLIYALLRGRTEGGSRNISPSTTRHALVIGRLAPGAIRASTFPPRHPVSKIHRHMDLTPAAEEQRILMRPLVAQSRNSSRGSGRRAFRTPPLGRQPRNMPRREPSSRPMARQISALTSFS
jgi:hypothetical protein